MKMLLLAVFTFFFFTFSLNAQTFYASPTSTNSTGTGTDINNPVTLARALALIPSSTTTACTVYLRGGNYVLTSTITISRSGAATNIKNLCAYPGDPRPVLDFSTITRITISNTGIKGVSFSGSYWYIKGIDFFAATDNGLNMSGSNNKVENCIFSENQDTGFQMGGGASNNQIINCDSYFNQDPTGENADGFAAKLDIGTGNSFKGCRSWQNSDDGWDGYLRPANDVSTTYEDCWAFRNGYTKSGGTTTAGDGNGFKTGGSDNKDLSHNVTLTRCLSFFNKADGFDQNSNIGNITLLNCTAFNNGRNYGMNDRALATGKIMTIKNCISAGTGGQSIMAAAVLATDSWTAGPGGTGTFTVTNADFVSVDTAGVRGARQADGSLPVLTFMHLATGSDLIDRGTNIGLPFNGTAPDLGAFETSEPVPVTLLSFSATAKGQTNILNWTTVTELNNASFIIESSANGIDFTSMGEIKGAGTTSTPQYYTFLDNNPSKGINYYRLRQLDFDGKATFSKIVSLTNATDKTNTLKIYPSVTNHILTVDVQIELNATLFITDSMGRTVLSQSLDKTGFTRMPLDVSAFSNGVYLLTIVSKSGQKTEKFIKN